MTFTVYYPRCTSCKDCGGHRRIIFVFLHAEVGSREIKMVDNRNLCLCAREGF